MNIGKEIKMLRIKNGLTQEELADRCELSKGFISQVERDLASPSISTLSDLLQCLGTDLKNFFNSASDEEVVFKSEDVFVKEYKDEGSIINWIVPNSQKNDMEPIIIELHPGGKSYIDDPHDGEEFGYVLSGGVVLHIGGKKYRVKKNESFYFKPNAVHYIENKTKTNSKVLWVSTPPTF
ncbi:MAG: helix-turn-helix transcriptional regulator [Clostridia bacterium]|nr:helix-turn-helix transcriptional regulator [Clostridia bacterium]